MPDTPKPKSWLVSVLFLTLFCIEGGAPGYARERLSPSACSQMHSHQMKILSQNPSHPFVKSLNLKAEDLRKPADSGQLAFCRRYLSKANYACQMKAKSIPAMMACYQKFSTEYKRGYADAKRNPLPKSPKRSRRSEVSDTKLPDYTKELNETETSSQNVVVINPENLPNRPVAVTNANCRNAYTHMLALLLKSPDLRRIENRRELVADWKSEEARTHFTKRCLEKFQPDDLGCVLGAKDREVLQACLLVVPG